ncbi:MAG TPA: CsgG/HfaB family protein [Bryobacteraceae bacterium]|nr:CsgG/HfaB family protein [Bryobacteraceae bacterium]
MRPSLEDSSVPRNICCLLSLFCTLASAFAQAAAPKRVAVLDFDYATVSTSVLQIFGSNQDIGKGITDMLVNRFVKDQAYRVIERKALDKILAEQNFSNSDRADPNTAAKLAKVLGVDAIVIGSITQFGRDDKHIGLGGAGGHLGAYGLGGLGKKDSKAVVVITARIISTETAEILASEEGKGESKRSGMNMGGGGGNWAGGGGGALDMGSSNFGATIIGEAVHQAVDNLAVALEQDAGRLPTTVVHLTGEIADVSGNTLIINIGSKSGVQVGSKLAVKHFVREVKDPATGKVIKRVTTPLGEMTITEVDADSATGTFAGSAPPKVGDSVESVQ